MKEKIPNWRHTTNKKKKDGKNAHLINFQRLFSTLWARALTLTLHSIAYKFPFDVSGLRNFVKEEKISTIKNLPLLNRSILFANFKLSKLLEKKFNVLWLNQENCSLTKSITFFFRQTQRTTKSWRNKSFWFFSEDCHGNLEQYPNHH